MFTSWSVAVLLASYALPTMQAAVNVTLYYESLCPDSIKFVKEQLYPTWSKLSPECLTIDFVPYGFSSQRRLPDGRWNFTCQHGPQECLGNKVQACALNFLRDQPAQQVEFVNCFMTAESPNIAGEKCSNSLNITYGPIENCTCSQQGDELLASLGDQTNNFKPDLSWIPTVAFNNVFVAEYQKESMSNFLAVVCKKITEPKPSACSKP